MRAHPVGAHRRARHDAKKFDDMTFGHLSLADLSWTHPNLRNLNLSQLAACGRILVGKKIIIFTCHQVFTTLYATVSQKT